ncbi:quinohemoprotein amine dehydrogenase subunit alpha [Marinovum sp.]|uniref:quinohemoprotein amine dehydrogenase subunit alpha n=1 Tax=Marinovum sp. TaxID=2024839 RepID=UPI002B26666D|nr:quinohemoprotein amine dehydrogenase subunit alpha [Marinovum sp.]
MPSKSGLYRTVSTASLLLASNLASPALGDTGFDVFDTICTSCHVTRDDGAIERIDAVRKTPEAWDMTVVRMMRNHGVEMTAEERRAVVKYLSDTRGLSVEETAEYRYILEKEPVASDAGPNQQMTETCGRCHSYARVALQRRTGEDWEHLINFHLGQFPSLEYQALARDRDWWGTAQTDILAFLSETYPLGKAPEAVSDDLSGRYVLSGREPGRGDYTGEMRLQAADEGYDVVMMLDYPDGSETYSGRGLIYGEGEWRATLTSGDVTIRQVMALSGDTLSGRWFHAAQDVTGGRITALAEGAAPQVIGITPAAVAVGVATEVTLTGSGLTSAPVLPEGVKAEVVSASANSLTLSVTADVAGALSLGLEGFADPVSLVAYDRIDRITVVPEVAMARVGGNGGPIPKVPAQFEAYGWTNGPDGTPDTEDDLKVGVVDVTWSFDNWDEAAAAIEDAKYAGELDDTGLFMPGGAGPNPDRVMSTNNTGNLRVTATYNGVDGPLSAEAHLYATVQRFVDTPIR